MGLILFKYSDNQQTIILSIGKHIDQNPLSVTGRGTKGQAMYNSVSFHAMDIEFNDSYVALSAFETLVHIYLHREYDQNKKYAATQFHHEGQTHNVYGGRLSMGEDRRPHLKLGFTDPQRVVVMNATIAHQFDGALRKAMNWICPWPQIHTRLDR